MAYLPGVPNVGPAPVNPTISAPAHTSIGKPAGIAAVAHTVGKPGNTQHFGSVVGRTGSGISALGGGSSAQHSMNDYGKKPPALLGGEQMAGGMDPTAHKGASMIRGGSGGMRTHIREGGLGPGPMSTPGPSDTDYSMNSSDTE